MTIRSVPQRPAPRRCLAALVLLMLPSSPLRAQEDTPFVLRSTELVQRVGDASRAVLEVELERGLVSPARLQVLDADGALLHERTPSPNDAGTRQLFDVPLPAVGERRRLDVVLLEGDAPPRTFQHEYGRPDVGWVLHLVPGFHYDPVWWNTQAHYTETGRLMDAHVGAGFTLMDAYLERLAADPEWRVAFHQLPYLKTWMEAHPQRIPELLDAVARGQAGLVGGSYNEFSSTLVSAEAAARNAIHGTLFQRDVVGGSADIFWQCDVFGHDPSFPSVMARSGHRAGAFARGPFHQWGIDRDLVNFPSEFLWMAPDGRAVLTHYMTGHYGYAYAQLASGTNVSPPDALLRLSAMFADLKQPALTHHVLLPMHMDFIRPMSDLADVVRAWNATYVSPRLVMDTAEGFFEAVRTEIDERDLVVSVQTRDMNPIYTGCAVSFADLKTANREAETTLRDAELWASVAWLEGARYPQAALDRAWRQLLFNAHHDGITGSMSDQVYLDILDGYHDALEIARDVRDTALAQLGTRIDPARAEAGGAQVVWNSMSTARPGRQDVPAVGYRVVPSSPTTAAVAPVPDPVLENAWFRLEFDVEAGGTLRSLVDKRAGSGGAELLKRPGHDLALLEEYSVLPGHGEGPWHLAPTGRRESATDRSARLLPAPADGPPGLVLEVDRRSFRSRTTVTLPEHSPRIDFRTEILGWRGRNELLRAEFPLDLPGARPIHQTAAAVIGRPFARDVDTADDSWTLDQACWQWAGLGAVARVVVVDADGAPVHQRALGVAEIVVDDRAGEQGLRRAADLARGLVHSGVTSTTTWLSRRRYGDLELDSNLPDLHLVLRPAGPGVVLWDGHPDAPLGDGLPSVELPLDRLPAVLEELARSHTILVSQEHGRIGAPRQLVDRGVALVNQGSVSVHVSPDGTLGLNLLRSCTSWPSGVWIDPPARRLPDGAPMGTMHGSHVFAYSLVPYLGDHREAGVDRIAQQVQQPLVTARTPGEGSGTAAALDALPPVLSFLSVEPPDLRLTALKRAGYGPARWHAADPPAGDLLVARLWNPTGRAQVASLRTHHALLGAWTTDLLEQREGPLPRDGHGCLVPMGPNETVSVLLQLQRRANDPALAKRPSSDTQVDTAAYWLENLGEGVTLSSGLALAPEVRDVALDGEGRTEAVFHVSNLFRDAPTEVVFGVTGGEVLQWIAPPSVTLEPGETRRLVLPLERSRSQAGGDWDETWLELLARVASARTGERMPPPVVSGVWVRTAPDRVADTPAVSVHIPTTLVPARGTLTARLVNHTPGPLRGLATWQTPAVLWDDLPGWRQSLVIPAGSERLLEVPITSDVDSFAVLKFSFGGRLVYGETVGVVADPDDVLVTFDGDRSRLQRDAVARVVVTARSLRGLDEHTPLQLTGPAALRITEAERRYANDGDQESLRVQFDVHAKDAPLRGKLRARVADGPESTTEYTVARRQTARGALGLVVPDGDLAEWDDAEFTHASGPRGHLRVAVRHGARGLALAFDVEDERFVQTQTGAAIWQGDSVQWALSVAPATTAGYSARDLEFGAALTGQGPLVWCWYGGETSPTGRVRDAELGVRRSAGRLVYEMTIPRSALATLPIEPGAVLGFSYIANDDDGDGYQGATEWTDGMTGGKDSSLFGELELLPLER